ncbi:hypothetical protein SMC26_39490 [Actinomadura fulvescens]
MGRAGAGKDTAAEALAVVHGHARIAFADPLKRMALAADPIVYVHPDTSVSRLSDVVERYGWEAAKRQHPEVRRFLQRLGSEGVRDVVGSDTWIDLAHREAMDAWTQGRPVVITDVRFPNEVTYARDYGYRLIWIDRPGVTDGGHASESAVRPEDADRIVYNGGSVADLAERMALALMD